MTGNGQADFSRRPPHDLGAEQCVLGGMMMSKDAIADVVEIIGPLDHYKPAHQLMHEAILDLYGRGEPVNVITVADLMGKQGVLPKAGGLDYLHTVFASVPTAASAGYYARIVREKAILRRLAEAGTRITQLSYDGTGDADELVDRAEAEIYAVTERRAGEDYLPIAEVLPGTLDQVEAISRNGGEFTGVPTGFASLDSLTHGLHPGQMIVIAARPALGKTTIALDCARAASVKHGLATVIFSLEMNRDEITMRLLSAEARVLLHHMRTGQMVEDDWTRLSRRTSAVADAPLFIDDSPNMSIMEIRAKCRRLKQRHGLRLVIVDYLQLMGSPQRRVENRQQEVSDISRSLKLLAKELDVPVIAVSQLNRGPEQRSDKRPLLSDLRESGCMPASARLLRADNGEEVTLGELVLSQQQPLVLSVDNHQRLVPAQLTRAFPSGIKPVFRLRLASGREVDATANHQFLTIDGWERLDRLTCGSFIAAPRILPQPEVVAEDAFCDDELLLMAHLISDGSIGPGVKYATADPANKEAVEGAAARLFGIQAEADRPGGKKCWQIWFPSPYRLTHKRYHPMRIWLEPLGLWGSRSHNKFIPESVFGISDRQMALFLHHLWATDGSITVSRNGHGSVVHIYYATTSRRLAENVQRALLRFEVRSRISRARKAGYDDCWHVTVQSAPDLIRFLRRVGCHGARGQVGPEALELLGRMTANPNVDLVPWPVAYRIKDALAHAGITHRALAEKLGERYCGSYLLGHPGRPRRFSRGRLERIGSIVGSPELQDIATSDLYWDEITEIVPLGPMPTFDATVAGTHNFVANGVVAHNSLEQDSDLVILIHREDAYDRDSLRAGEADLIVAKHRNGPTAVVTVAFQGHYSRFVDMAPAYAKPPPPPPADPKWTTYGDRAGARD